MYIVIIGCDRVGSLVANRLSNEGHKVVVIDNDEASFENLSSEFSGFRILGDAGEVEILKQAGTEEAAAGGADCLIAMTPADEDNLIACQVADRIFGVPRILALVNNPENVEIFKKLGIKLALSTVEVVSRIIEEKIEFEEITNLIPLAEGKINVTEVELTYKSPVLGTPLKDIKFPKGALLACVIRKDTPIIPRGFTILEEGDKLVLITMPDEYEKALRLLTGGK